MVRFIYKKKNSPHTHTHTVCQSICSLSVCVSFCLSVNFHIPKGPFYLFVCQSISTFSVCLSVCLSICLSTNFCRQVYVTENLPFYSSLLLEFLARSFQLDLTSDIGVTLLFRVTKV